MAIGPFSGDKAEQTTEQNQIGSQVGDGSSSLIVGAKGKLFSTRGSKNSDIGDVTLFDPAATIKALDANQALSTQAISFANINANNALQTVQSLANQLPSLAAGMNPAAIFDNGGMEGEQVEETFLQRHKNQIAVAIISGIAVTVIIFAAKKISKTK